MKTLLTTQQFEDIASKQLVSVNTLSVYKKTIDFIPRPDEEKVKASPLFYYTQVYETLDLIFEGLRLIIDELDNTADILYSTDERAELEALGVVIDPMFDEE